LKSFLAGLSALAVVLAVAGLTPPGTSIARADDEPALLDGGAIATSTDGGRCVVVDTGPRGPWHSALTCEGAQSSRYKFCSSTTCAPTAINPLAVYNTRTEIPVNQRVGLTAKRYLGFCTDDGGVPYCLVEEIR
jgi:hypothetical protein